MNALVYVNIDQGIHSGKQKFALNEKRKKLRGFLYSKRMANFEYLRPCLHGDFCLWKPHSVYVLISNY